MKKGEYLVLVKGLMHPPTTVHNMILNSLEGDERWHDSGEGPWETAQAAFDFGSAEVGLPWIVVEVVQI